MVKNSSCKAGDEGSVPGQRTKIPQAVPYSQKILSKNRLCSSMMLKVWLVAVSGVGEIDWEGV